MKGCVNKVGASWGFTIDVEPVNGRRKQKRFGRYKTKKAAETACNEMLYQRENGTYIVPKTITLKEYLTEWLEDVCKPKLSDTTFDSYTTMVEKHINPALGNVQLQKLQPILIQKFYNDKLGIGKDDCEVILSATSVRYIHSVLRKALNDAVRLQYIQRSIINMVQPPKATRHEAKFLTKTDVANMMELIKTEDVYMPVLLAVGLGLRRGEVLGLQWKDIDFEKSSISIKRTYLHCKDDDIKFRDCKTDKSNRMMIVPNTIMDTLKAQSTKYKELKLFFGQGFNDYDLVCCRADGKPIAPNSLNHQFTRTLAKHELPHIRFHDLRHTNASLMLSQGVPMKVASDRLGHSTIVLTMDLYSHIDEELQQDAADKLNSIFAI